MSNSKCDKVVKARPPRNEAKTKLKALRVKAGKTQKEVAEAAGVSLAIYYGYEQGARSIDGAKIITLVKICNVLGCDLKDIMENKETIKELKEYDTARMTYA